MSFSRYLNLSCFVLHMQLCGDVDKEVRQGVGFVDSLLKEETAAAAAAAAAEAAARGHAATATTKGPITPAFVQLIVERLLVRNPYIKLLAVKPSLYF